MFPGLTTRVSEENVALTTTPLFPKSDLIRINDTTNTTVVTTITPPFAGFSGIMILVNVSGNNITTVTTGNVIKAVTIPTNQTCLFVYSKSAGVWYPGPIS